MIGAAMLARNRARYLAPIALVAAIGGTYLVVHSGLKTNHANGQTQHKPVSRAHRKYARVRFYVVQPGDNLTSIAQKTGLSVTTLEALNANLDPNSLQAAQRLRLRR
jgi:LysM repeat protein